MFERVAFFVMAVVALAAIGLAVGFHAYDTSVVIELRQELKSAKAANEEWLHAFQKLAERVNPAPAPRRPGSPGQIGDAPPH